MKKFHLILFAALISMMATSCVMDHGNEELPAEEDVATIVLAPMTGSTRAVTDQDISTLRVLIYKPDGAKNGLIYNFYYPNASDITDPIELKIRVGKFHFVFIANEHVDVNLHNTLSNLEWWTPITSIEGLYFDSASFSEAKDIPMVGVIRNVQVKDDNDIVVAGNEVKGKWDVTPYILRLGIRVDMTINANSEWFWNSVESLQVTNLPDRVYLFEENSAGTKLYNGASTLETLARTLSNFDFAGKSETVWKWQKDRIILPSSVFKNITVQSNAIAFQANIAGTSPRSATIGYNEPYDYTSPRNYYYTLLGTLNDQGLSFTVKVNLWPQMEPVDLQ